MRRTARDPLSASATACRREVCRQESVSRSRHGHDREKRHHPGHGGVDPANRCRTKKPGEQRRQLSAALLTVSSTAPVLDCSPRTWSETNPADRAPDWSALKNSTVATAIDTTPVRVGTRDARSRGRLRMKVRITAITLNRHASARAPAPRTVATSANAHRAHCLRWTEAYAACSATHGTAGPVMPQALGLVELKRDASQRDAERDDRHDGDRSQVARDQNEERGNQGDDDKPSETADEQNREHRVRAHQPASQPVVDRKGRRLASSRR